MADQGKEGPTGAQTPGIKKEAVDKPTLERLIQGIQNLDTPRPTTGGTRPTPDVKPKP